MRSSDKNRPHNRTKDTLRRLEHKPKKSRGQNFLLDKSVLEKIVEFGEVKPSDKVIEIGPGLGALTDLLNNFSSLTLIEIEPKFCDELSRKYPKVEIINSDVRGVDFSKFGSDMVIFGNLPYVYSSEIIFHLLEFRQYISRAIFLLQDEFAQRMAAKPNSRDYGVLTVNLQIWCDVKLGDKVPGDSFHPPTKVTSSIVRLDFLKQARFDIPPHELFRRVVQAAFSQRRKKIRNSLASSGQFSREKIESSLASCGIDGNRRAETLSLKEFADLSKIIL